MSLPSREVTIKINEYAGRNQSAMLYSGDSANVAYILVETLCTFTVLIPKLVEDLKVKSLFDLDPVESRELINQYSNVFFPWFQEWLKEINAPFDAKK
jgi:hypothetical protein